MRCVRSPSRPHRPSRFEASAHFRGALETRRGVVLVTGHFGFPPAIRAAFEATGTPWLTLRQYGLRDGGASLPGRIPGRVSGDSPFGRLARLSARTTPVYSWPTAGRAPAAHVPFLDGTLDLSLGAFALARAAGCPILPFFAPLLGGPSRLRVEIEAPFPPPVAGSPDASDTDAIGGAARAFAVLYETYVRRYPSSRYWAGGR